MFLGALTTAFIGITGVGDLVGPQVLGAIAIAGTTITIGGTLWRVYFPDTSKEST